MMNIGVAAFMGGQGSKAGSIGYSENVAPTIKSVLSGGNTIPDVCYALQGNGIDRADTAGCNGCGWRENESYTLNTIDRQAVCFANRPFTAGDTSEVVKTLCAEEASKQPGITVVYDTTQITSPQNGCNPKIGDPCHPLAAQAHPPLYIYDCRGNGDGSTAANLTGDHENRVTDYTNCCVLDRKSYAQFCESEIGSTLTAHNSKEFSDLCVGKKNRRYIVRRLTPLELCRLQGFPDWWTDGVEGSDSAQYKMWGNGMALPNMLHVMRGIARKENSTKYVRPSRTI